MQRAVCRAERENRRRPNRRRDAEREPSSSTDRASPVASLQRAVGNRAVQRLHEAGELQAKPRVSQPTDAAEREAERVTEQVMRTPCRRGGSCSDRRDVSSPSIDTAGPAHPPRIDESPRSTGTTGDRYAGDGVGRQLASISGGRPLPQSTRSFFEPRFDRRFGDVRIHDGPTADEIARSIDAVGFTYDTDVGFRNGAYRPGTPGGKALIAHELVHVVQQDASSTPRRSVAHRTSTHSREDGDRSHADAHESPDASTGSRSGVSRRSAGGVVQRTPDDGGGQSSYTPAPAAGGPQSSGLMSIPRPREAPQSGETSFGFSRAPTPDPTCRDISESSKATLRRILQVVNSEVDGFVRWRTGRTWDTPAGQRIPRTERLQRQFQLLTGTTFVCADDPTKALPPDDPLIKEYLFRGIGDQEGMTETDVDYINEWMRYEGERSIPSIQSYFGLSPQPIQHNYGVQVELGGTVLGLGIGLGGKAKAADIGIELGCYVDVQGDATWLEFAYSNELGMRWTVEYLAGDVSLGVECSIGASVGGVETSFGSEEFCTGAASSTLYYGPSDFAGSQTGWDAGAGTGAGVGIKGGGGALTIDPSSGLPSLTFDTTGACGKVLLGGEVTIGEGAGSWGGQIDISDAEVTTAPVRDVYALLLGPLYELLPDGRRTLVTRHLFYDTGSSDTLGGAYASHNEFAIRDLAAALDEAGQVFPPDEVEFMLTGHASPRWRAAESPEEAAEENRALAGNRIADARNTVLAMYSQYLYLGGWPPASFSVPEMSVVNLTEIGPFTSLNLGSSVGLAETGDPRNDAQLYRRVTTELVVAHYRERRLNVIDLLVPPQTRVLYCPFLPQSRSPEQ